jgi:uncharacterized membrane-anchored protein YitT (DUF2179 family)
MGPMISLQVIVKSIKKKISGKGSTGSKNSQRSSLAFIQELETDINNAIKNTVFIALGILSAGFGLNGFLIPNGFIDGGAIGISLLAQIISEYPISILLIVVNAPFIMLGYFQIGPGFVIKSVLAIVGLALAVEYINYPEITSDNLLVAIFGGVFLGAGVGLSVRGGAVLDGTKILAIFLSRKTGLTLGDFLLIFNIIILSVGAYVLSIEIALYAVLTYLAASKTVDFIVEGVEEYIGVTVISNRSEKIRLMIIQDIRRGVTMYTGKRGYGKQGDQLDDVDVIYTVITRLELARLKKKIKEIDPDAFIVMNSVKDLYGGMIKKRSFKE